MYENKLYFPVKHEPRQIQLDMLNHVKQNIRRGKKYFLLNAPTGTGKSFFVIMLANWYKNYINEFAKFDILTNSKVLQNQYVREFPFISSLKGRNNYTCKTYNATCAEGKEMNKALKKTCTACPYTIAMATWEKSNISLTNFHLFDTLHLFVPRIIEERDSNVLIIDEAHDFESILCDYISNKISQRTLKKLGFNDASINKIDKEMNSVKNTNQFIKYVKDKMIPYLKKLQEFHKNRIGNHSITSGEKLKLSKSLTNIESNLLSFGSLIEDFTDNPDNWVLDIEIDKKHTIFQKIFNIQPVWAYNYLSKIIYNKYDHVIFMSGTILDKKMFAYLNGLEPKLCTYFNVDSPFAVKNRKIKYIKVGKMSFNEKKDTWIRQQPVLEKIFNKHKDEKGIIHVSSYELVDWFKKKYGNDKRFLFPTAEDKDVVLFKHTQSKEPTVLVSPSMMNGVDLKDDLSRFQIILKIPYPNLKSNRVKKRMSDLKDWYGYKTVTDLIQSYGRSVRNDEDYAITYILDSNFSNILQFNYKLLPDWFINAISELKQKRK